MQIKKIVVAVTTALAAGLATAAVVTQNDINAARSVGSLQEAWVSGASTPAFSIYNAWHEGCDDGSEAIFTSNVTVGKPGAIGGFSAYACTRGGAVSVMYHTTDGGSINAYAPHMNTISASGEWMLPVQLKRLKNLGTVACSLTGSWNGIVEHAGCGTVTGATAGDGAPIKPAGGFSEVEGSMFGLEHWNSGNEQDTNLTQAYGVAVSKNLYRALQVAQGIYATAAEAESTDPDYDPVHAPILFRAEYTSLAASGGGYQTDWSPLLGAAGIGKNVHIARRIGSSGTQASSDAYFLASPCAGNPSIGGALLPASAAESTSTFIVTEGVTENDAKSTLTAAASAGNYAIGVLSMVNNWRTDSTSTNGYRFVKLNGAHPEGYGDVAMARAAAVKGHNDFVSEVKVFVANSASGTYGETMLNEISARMGVPSHCADVPRGLFLNPVGIFNIPAGVTSDCVIGADVGKGTKFGNTCSPVQLFF